MAVNSYKALQRRLATYLRNGAKKDNTIRKNKGNLVKLLSEKEHDEILTRLETERESSLKDYDSILVEVLTQNLVPILTSEASGPTKSSYYATVGNILKSRGYKKEEIKRLLPVLKDYRKEEEKVFNPITFQEYKKIQDAIKNRISTTKSKAQLYLAKRDFAILRLAYETGARSREIANLRWENIDFEGRTISLIDTDKKTRKAPVEKSTVDILKDLAQFHRENSKGRTSIKKGTFFKNRNGKRISTRSLRRKIELWMDEANIKESRQAEISLTSYRDAYAAYLVKKDIDIKSFTYLMGFTVGTNSKKTYYSIKNKIKRKGKKNKKQKK